MNALNQEENRGHVNNRHKHHAEVIVWVVEAEWRYHYNTSQQVAPVEQYFSVMLTILIVVLHFLPCLLLLLLASLHGKIAYVIEHKIILTKENIKG